MAESEKKTTKKAAPKETEPSKDNKASTQSIVIAVLATVLVCLVLVFGVLLASGVIKLGNSGYTPGSGTEPTKVDMNGGKTGGTTTGSKIINNPNQRVTAKDSTLASVKDLEFYSMR